MVKYTVQRKLVLTDEETKTYEVTNLNSLERAMLLAGDFNQPLESKVPTPEAAQKALGQVKAAFDAEVGPKAFDLKALQNSGAFASTTAKSMDDAYESSLYAQIPNTLAGAQAEQHPRLPVSHWHHRGEYGPHYH